MNKGELAVEFKRKGNNCAQAVICAFQQETGLTEEMSRQLGAGFGSGMGCMEGTCGALCGAQIVQGLKKYAGRSINPDSAALHKAFTAKCGASLCKDLKGRDTGHVICSCEDCVRNAANILEGML